MKKVLNNIKAVWQHLRNLRYVEEDIIQDRFAGNDDFYDEVFQKNLDNMERVVSKKDDTELSVADVNIAKKVTGATIETLMNKDLELLEIPMKFSALVTKLDPNEDREVLHIGYFKPTREKSGTHGDLLDIKEAIHVAVMKAINSESTETTEMLEK